MRNRGTRRTAVPLDVTADDGQRRSDFLKSLLIPSSRVGAGAGAQLAGPTARITALNLGSMAFAFVTSVVLSRLLGARGYGTYVYAFAFPSVLAVLAPLGTGQLLVRNLATYSVRREFGRARGLIHYSRRLVLVASTVLVAGTAIVAWVFVGNRQPLLRQTLFVSLPLVPVMAVVTQNEAILRGFRRVVLGRLSETFIQPIVLLMLIVLVHFVNGRGLSPVSAMSATLAAGAAAMAAGWIFVSRVTPVRVRRAASVFEPGTWTKSAWWLVAISGLQVVNLQMSVLLLGAIENVDSAAVLSVALRWSGLVSFLQTAAVFALAPMLARLHAAGDGAEFQRVASRMSRTVLMLSAPIAAGLLVLGSEAMGLFGSHFETGTTALTILVIGEIVNVASGFVGPILISTGHERTLFATATWVTLVRLGFSAALIQLFGLNGAAVGQAAGLVLQNLALVILVWRRERVYSPAIGLRVVRPRDRTELTA